MDRGEWDPRSDGDGKPSQPTGAAGGIPLKPPPAVNCSSEGLCEAFPQRIKDQPRPSSPS